MNTVSKTRALQLISGALLIAAAACVDGTTAPSVNGKRALRDTSVVTPTDSSACRQGWTVILGRIVCNPEQ